MWVLAYIDFASINYSWVQSLRPISGWAVCELHYMIFNSKIIRLLPNIYDRLNVTHMYAYLLVQAAAAPLRIYGVHVVELTRRRNRYKSTSVMDISPEAMH